MNYNPKHFELWSYKQMGRTFIIDGSLPGDSNILKAVAEVLLPEADPLSKKSPHESPLNHKHRLCNMKEVIGNAMLLSMKVAGAYDEGDLEHG